MKKKQNVILIIAAISFFFHILAVFFSLGAHHPDEHFQILEFLNYKLGKTDASGLTWEFESQIRPWFQIYIYYYVIKFLNLFGVFSPFYYAFFFRLVSSLLGFSAICSFYPLIKKWFQKESNQILAWASINLFWFIPFFHARTSSENLSASVFFIAMSLFLTKISYLKDIKKPSFYGLICGLLLGACFLLRYQMGIMVAFFWFWALFLKKAPIKSLITCSIGIVLMSALGIVIDHWGYDAWTFAPWNYLHTNIFLDKASSFGVDPWWFYFTETLVKGIPPFSIIMILATLVFWAKFPKHPLTWITLPFIIAHSSIAHKELRFIFVVISVTPIFLIFCYEKYYNNLNSILKYRCTKPLLKATVGINFVLMLLSIFTPPEPSINLKNFIHNKIHSKTIHYFSHLHVPLANFTLLKSTFFSNEKLELIKIKDTQEIDYKKDSYVLSMLPNRYRHHYLNGELYLFEENKINGKYDSTLRYKGNTYSSDQILNKKEFTQLLGLSNHHYKDLIEHKKAYDNALMIKQDQRCKIIYSSTPQLIIKYSNFNNWTSRSRVYQLFHCKN